MANYLPDSVRLTLEPGTIPEGASGEILRIAVHARHYDGSDAYGAHVIFRVDPNSVPATVLDPDVLTSPQAGAAVANVRVRPMAGAHGTLILQATVAATDGAPLQVSIPVRNPELVTSSGPAAGFGSVLDGYEFAWLRADLMLDPPTPANPIGNSGYEVSPQAIPRLKLAARDVLLSQQEVTIPGVLGGPIETIYVVSLQPHFDGRGSKVNRGGTVEVSYPANPAVAPRTVKVPIPDGTAVGKRAIRAMPPTPPYTNWTFQTEDVPLALEPVSGYRLAAPRSGRPFTFAASVRPGSAVGRPSAGGSSRTVPLPSPQVGVPDKTLPIPFQVRVVNARGEEYKYRPSAALISTPGEVVKVTWTTTAGGLLSISAAAAGQSQYASVPIDQPIYLTPAADGPWFLEAMVGGSVFDPSAPVLNVPGWAQPYRSTLELAPKGSGPGRLVHRFVIQRSIGEGLCTTRDGSERTY